MSFYWLGRVAGINRAQERAEEAGLRNVSFEVVDDLAMFRPRAPVDAVVGRLILMYLQDPAAILSHLTRQVRPGGIIAFQELVLSLCRSEPSCPLVQKCLEWVHDTFVRAGADVEMDGSFSRPSSKPACLILKCFWARPSARGQTRPCTDT
jgi:ubiquinone/menaquinone biosynthesis C-methylase UbiE